MNTRVAVIGTGYVGLTTGACLAHLGHEVICHDIDQGKILLLSRGMSPIHEAGLDDLLSSGISSGLLGFTDDVSHAVRNADVVFLCVPTPQGDDGSADLSYIEAAASEISRHLRSGAIVVNKSTVPVGSSKVVEEALGRSDVQIVSNPEFLREGSAVNDFLHPDRIVIGAIDAKASQKVAELYEKLSSTVICTDPASAETIKYAANAFLATKLSFINAIAAICEGVGADVNSVIDGIGSDPRIGRAFLQPGPGWGGSCFPKDSRALLRIAEQVGHDFHLLRSVITANLEQFDRVVSKVREAVSGSLEDKTVAVWGLTFKAGTDDLRASPALEIVSRLLSEGARVQAYDPMVESPKSEIPTSVELHKSPENSCVDADVLVLLTEWEMFCSVSPKQVASLMKGRALIDARNLLSRSAWQEAGFSYCGIGR